MDQGTKDGAALDELLQVVRSYGEVALLELQDVQRSLPAGPEVLLRQGVERMKSVLATFGSNVETIAAKLTVPSAVEGLGQNVVDLVRTYATLGQLIERETVNLRAVLKPDTDPAVMDALRNIAALLQQIKRAGEIEVPR